MDWFMKIFGMLHIFSSLPDIFMKMCVFIIICDIHQYMYYIYGLQRLFMLLFQNKLNCYYGAVGVLLDFKKHLFFFFDLIWNHHFSFNFWSFIIYLYKSKKKEVKKKWYYVFKSKVTYGIPHLIWILSTLVCLGNILMTNDF
jgi:hypothetical protein